MGSKVSTCGDVYSYGILLLEMFTGKRPTDDMFNDGLTLSNYVLTALPERVEQITDPTMCLQELEGTANKNFMVSIFSIGVSCAAQMPSQRMNIGDVVAQLCLERENFSHGLDIM